MRQFIDIVQFFRWIGLLGVIGWFCGTTALIVLESFTDHYKASSLIRYYRRFLGYCWGLTVIANVLVVHFSPFYKGISKLIYSSFGTGVILQFVLLGCLLVIWLIPISIKPVDEAAIAHPLGSRFLAHLSLWIAGLLTLSYIIAPNLF